MSNNPLNLPRNQLAEFLPNARAVRAFEQLLKQVNDLIPTDVNQLTQLILEAANDAALASAQSQSAIDQLSRIAEALELISQAPVPVAPLYDLDFQFPRSDQLTPDYQPPSQLSIGDLSDVRNNLPAAGNVLIYDATLRRYISAALSAGSNITVTNADGSISIKVSGITGAAVGTTDTQTLTNKTLTAAILGGTTNLSGGQLKFPAAQSASSDPNTLDDYEEGSFGVYFGGDTTNPTATYTDATGRYTKIGNVVNFSVKVLVNTISGGSGALRLYGLPFVCISDTVAYGITKAFVYNWVNNPKGSFQISPGVDSILIYKDDTTNTIAVPTDLQAGSYFLVSGFYRTA